MSLKWWKNKDYQPRILSLVKLSFKDASKISHFQLTKTDDVPPTHWHNSQEISLNWKEMTTCHSDSQGMKSLRNGKYLANMKDYIDILSALNFLLKHIPV